MYTNCDNIVLVFQLDLKKMVKDECFWKNPHYKHKSSLKKDISCEFLIVGGGVAGVSLAYFLNKLGAKNIVLIEKNEIASGATGRAAGMLTHEEEGPLLQDIFKALGSTRHFYYYMPSWQP